MQRVLSFLDGKKTIILGCVAIIIPYLVSQGVIDADLASLISSLFGVFGIGAKIVTK